MEISVLVVTYNEERYLDRCIGSLVNQSISPKQYEIIIVDGMSTDRTLVRAQEWQRKYPDLIRVLSNEKRILSSGWNIGIKAAKAPIIVRIDAHAEVPFDFLARNLRFLSANPEADVVGGRLRTMGEGTIGMAVAILMGTRFGVGNSPFRTSARSGQVDTVVYGAYRRRVFEKVGYFDESLLRNQDLDFHRRMKDAGMILYMEPSIESTYYVRSTLKGLLKQGFMNGYWNIVTLRSLSIRHLVPGLFILSLVLCSLAAYVMASPWVPLLILGPYLMLAGFSSLAALLHKKRWESLLLLPLAFAFHVAYGTGSLWRLVTMAKASGAMEKGAVSSRAVRR